MYDIKSVVPEEKLYAMGSLQVEVEEDICCLS